MSNTRNKNLVAVASAAVLSVYAAGYLRTRSASAGFGDEKSARRHTAEGQRVVLPMAPAVHDVAAVPQHVVTATVSASAPSGTPEAKPAKKGPKKPKAAAVDSALLAAEEARVAAIAKQAADSAAQAANKDRGPYRDGVYFGWGSSRHGDIQASVEIREGHIYSATIAQCLTRYTCAWIANLPGQVVTRQSPETDVVSGATQSSDAFYYAVVEALKLAK